MGAVPETMAFTGSRNAIWHGIGKQIPDDLTPEQILVDAGIDWEVKRAKASVMIDGVQTFLDTEALYRDDTKAILTEVSGAWNEVQNAQFIGFFHEFVMNGEMSMDVAGSLFGGRLVWASAKIKDKFAVFGDDEIESNFLITNPHQYGKGVNLRTVMTRAVCENTIQAAMGENSKRFLSINHSRPFAAERVKALMGLSHKGMERYKEQALVLGKKKYTKENIVEYFQRVFPLKGINLKKAESSVNAKKAMEVIHTQPGSKYAEGTFWQAFNAVTFMVDHSIGHNADSRMKSAQYGQGAEIKQKALELALEYAK